MLEIVILLRTDFMKRCFSYWLLSLIVFGVALPVKAGTLWLSNGDKISGEPDELSGGTLLWISDSAGPLKISQLNILFIQSDRDMLLQVGKDSLLEECRFEVDDGKPVDPPVRTEAVTPEGERKTSGENDTGETEQKKEKNSSNKPSLRSVPPASKTGASEEESPAEQAGTAADSSVQDQAEASPPPKAIPQQWVMCKEKGFILGGWNQVSRFFEFKLPEPDTMKASGKAMLVLEDESGNTDERTIDIDVYAEFRYQKSRHIMTVENTIESTSGTDTKDERKLSYQYDRFFTERWFWAGNGSWEENKFKDLSSRWIAGGGVGYQFFETDLLKISAQSGLSYVDEEFNDAEQRDYPALRSAANVNWLLSENGLRFIHASLLYQGLNRSNNWVIETETGFSMPLIGHFKVNFLFEYDYDNYPSSTAEKEDRIWKVGFSYEWGGATGLSPQ